MHFKKRAFPVHKIRQYLEPGPIVLVSSHHRGERNIMTMGWHTVMEFSPSLIGCVIASSNHSFDLIRRSKHCVINLPTSELTDTVVKIGNCSGRDTDKFASFNLTPAKARTIDAPLIRECYANFECRLHDTALIKKYNFFIFEVTAAHVATAPRHPETLHYEGDGRFMLSGKTISRCTLFKPEMLQ